MLVALLAMIGTAREARAEWRRTTDIELNTAFTQEEGSLSIGILSPLTVGVTDSFQAAIHPLLLLLGQTSLAFRGRVTPIDDVSAALNLAGTWSFIDRETRDGVPSADAGDAEIGFPGTLQLTETTSFRLGQSALLSAGAGVASDFIGATPTRGLVELHVAAHWLPASRHLVMLQLLGYVPFTEEARLMRPSAQVIYAWAASSRVQLVMGLGVGEWTWETADGGRSKVRIFPIADLWFRF